MVSKMATFLLECNDIKLIWFLSYSLTPLPFIDPDFSKTQGLFKGVGNPLTLTRDLNAVATKAEPASRGEGLIRIEVRE